MHNFCADGGPTRGRFCARFRPRGGKPSMTTGSRRTCGSWRGPWGRSWCRRYATSVAAPCRWAARCLAAACVGHPTPPHRGSSMPGAIRLAPWRRLPWQLPGPPSRARVARAQPEDDRLPRIGRARARVARAQFCAVSAAVLRETPIGGDPVSLPVWPEAAILRPGIGQYGAIPSRESSRQVVLLQGDAGVRAVARGFPAVRAARSCE